MSNRLDGCSKPLPGSRTPPRAGAASLPITYGGVSSSWCAGWWSSSTWSSSCSLSFEIRRVDEHARVVARHPGLLRHGGIRRVDVERGVCQGDEADLSPVAAEPVRTARDTDEEQGGCDDA